MRGILIILLLSVFHHFGYSQKKHKGNCFCPAEHAHNGSWYLSMQTGPLWQTYAFDDQVLSHSYGLRLGTNVSPSFSIQSGLDFYSNNDVGMGYPFSAMKNTNITVPLELQYRLPFGERQLVPFIIGGSAVNFTKEEKQLQDKDEVVVDDGFATSSIQWHAGVGLHYIISEKFSLFANGMYGQRFLSYSETSVSEKIGGSIGFTIHL